MLVRASRAPRELKFEAPYLTDARLALSNADVVRRPALMYGARVLSFFDGSEEASASQHATKG